MTTTFLSVAGARPNFLKLGPLARQLQAHAPSIRHVVVHTGQHYDPGMSDAFFRELALPAPDHALGIGSGSHAVQTAGIMTRFEAVLREVRPDRVIVFGDVNSTLACALVCAKEGVPVAHVEAGLRSFDRRMPEEINRVLTDQVSDLLFVTEPAGVANLEREGIDPRRVHLVGNILIDAVEQARGRVAASDALRRLGLESGRYFLCTLHRPANVDAPASLDRLVAAVAAAAERGPVLFPVHPRTKQRLIDSGQLGALGAPGRVIVSEPLGYVDFLCALAQARAVLTDSGGVQAEASHLDVPCFTLREATEQPVTLELGTNTLVSLDAARVLAAIDGLPASRRRRKPIPLWDGRAAERIVRVLLEDAAHRR